MQQNTLPKAERLCSETAIDLLFAKGRKRHAYPLLTIWKRRNDDGPARIVISVAKKRLHHAVDRNRVKRIIRAAYRQNKFPDGYDVALIYLSSKIEEYRDIEQSIKKVASESAPAEQ